MGEKFIVTPTFNLSAY